MKFGDKYELLESLTTGGVETFIANDKIRGERVLVHILHCDPQKQNQPTVQWVLESFRHVAPEPAALVLETGRYSGTLYAYLVSKLPDEPTLKAWVEKYEAQAKDTQEFPRLPATPTAESEAPTAEVGEKEPKEPEHPPGPVTQLFREFDLQAKSGIHTPPLKEMEQPSKPLPGVGGSGEKSGVRPAAPWDPEPAKISVPPKAPPSIGMPSDSFRPEVSARTFSPEAPVPPKDGPKPGEFTSFFQGPFRGDRPLETPAITPKQEAPRKSVGDFTAMFGAVKPQAEEPPPSPGIAGNEPAGTGFTGWFSPELPSHTSSTTSPPPSMGLPRAVDPAPVFPEPPKEPVVPAQPLSYVAFAPPIFPTPVPLTPPPMPKLPAITPSSLPSDGATRALARPNFDAAVPPAPPVPSGPSAYTQVISMKAMMPPAEAPAAQAPAPKLPTIAMPAPPPPPKLDLGAAPPPVSYWPLVLILTVLFFIAVLLVLYFVLKH